MILITGASGYVGRELARRLLAESDERVLLWLHAADAAEAQPKADKLRAQLAAELGQDGERLQFAFGELGAPAGAATAAPASSDPFAGVDPSEIRTIVHAAAITRFNVDAETADRVNLGGSLAVFRFAERCPKLENLLYVSTVYAAGLEAGPVGEELLPRPASFANHYERSKWEAERALAERYPHLPWRIARVATVIADDESGKVTQQNAVHNTLRLLFYGLLSLMPGRTDVPLYFVTGRFVAEALAGLTRASQPRTVYHVVHERDESLTLEELVELAYATFGEDEGFRARRILPPLFVDAESFDVLVDGVDGFGGEVTRQALGSVAPFARQLFVHKQFSNDRLRAALPAYAAPDPHALAKSVVGSLVRTRWGKAA